jgi:hypothetical protein
MNTQILTGPAAEAAADEPFWNRSRRRLTEADIVEAARLMGRAFAGNRFATVQLQEALSSDDFRAAAFDILDREMLERYQDLPQTWSAYCRRTTVRDFKKKRLVDLLGGRSALDPVPELSEYPERGVSKALYYLTVGKFGGRFQVSWESIVNDELGEIQNMPQDLAVAARDTESRLAAGLLTDGNGPNDAYFSTTAWGRTYDPATDSWSGGSSNLMTTAAGFSATNPALTVDALTNAMTVISSRHDLEGRPIAIPGFVLVVPPALEVAASQIVNAVQIRATATGVAGNGEQVIMNNWLAGKIKVVVDPWLPVLDASANKNTTWYLLPDPTASRPALFLAFLRGHETPDLRVKADAGQSIGGGALPAEEGSFDVDDIQYRVRHVLGATGTDMIATAVSNGSGA